MTIRPVTDGDWPQVGHLAEQLVSMHHAFDGSRFMSPDDLRGNVYTARVRDELRRGLATVHVADDDGQVVGYVFAGIEPESWKELRREAGYIHDVIVGDDHQHAGIGRGLIASALEWFSARGVARVMLWTAYGNSNAQQVFREMGFRPTMVEMTLERD